MKRVFWIFLALMVPFFCVGQGTVIGVKTIVIDPGHGGEDPGAIGAAGNYEKDVALAVSLKLGKMIKEKYPNVKVIYTRENDKFVSLYDRAKLANQEKADLFISIHANAATNRSAYGSESWVLGLHKSAAALEVAKRENASILMEENHETKYEDFDPNNPDDYIAMTIRQSAYLEQSLELAAGIQDQFKNKINRFDRGVKQAGFLVLYKTTMPAVLVELGFMSNAKEEAWLISAEGQDEMATSIFNAISKYKTAVDNVNKSLSTSDGAPEKIDSSVTNVDPNKKVYKVQIHMSSNKIQTHADNFKGLNDIAMYESDGFYKYTSGEFDTFEEANNHKQTVRDKGYEAAFVVVFQGGKRIK